MATDLPLKKPEPDAEEFRNAILGKAEPKRVHLVEMHLDKEVVRYLVEQTLDRRWVEPAGDDRKTRELCLKNYIECSYRLGYDCVRLTGDFRFSAGLHFPAKAREGRDTAELSRSVRTWTEQGTGMIASWEDFERYPWPCPDEADLWPLEFVAANLPDGMGLLACGSPGVYEVPSSIMGYETLSYLLHDDPALVRAVFDRVGELILGWYQRTIGLDRLTGFFQGDDLGFKTATLISPDALRRYVLPWHKRIAALAHSHGLLYLFHSCGLCEPVMEDLIEDVRIDAKHSFEDEVTPVGEFCRRYGERIGALGGVDVDKLCRLAEADLRQYVRGILDECMPGRYALGTGNSVANYIPVSNYLAMLEEGLRWSAG